MTGLQFWREPDEWGVIYGSGRIVVIRGGAVGERNGRFGFDVATEPRGLFTVGTAPMDGELSIRSGGPRLRDWPETAAIVDAVERGDFSWAVVPEIEPPGRDDYSVSVFLPPGVDRVEMERAGQMILDDSGARHLDENIYFGWFRPLAPNLVPDPDSDEGRRLEAKAQQWGGMSAWEILGTGGMTLTHKLLLLAEHHDLLFYTADKRLYDPEGLRWRVDNEGIGWDCGWTRWLTGTDDPDTYDDEDDGDPPEPYVPLEPGPTLAHPLDEWALVYHDGAVVFVNAETVEQHGGYHWFNATTVDGDTFNLAWATETGTTHLLHGRPLLRNDPDAVAILDPLGWGQNPAPTTPDTDIRIDPLDW